MAAQTTPARSIPASPFAITLTTLTIVPSVSFDRVLSSDRRIGCHLSGSDPTRYRIATSKCYAGAHGHVAAGASASSSGAPSLMRHKTMLSTRCSTRYVPLGALDNNASTSLAARPALMGQAPGPFLFTKSNI
jgi:hypothetical protein